MARRACIFCGGTSYKKFKSNSAMRCLNCQDKHVPCTGCGTTDHDRFTRPTAEVCRDCSSDSLSEVERRERAERLWKQQHLLRPWGPVTVPEGQRYAGSLARAD